MNGLRIGFARLREDRIARLEGVSRGRQRLLADLATAHHHHRVVEAFVSVFVFVRGENLPRSPTATGSLSSVLALPPALARVSSPSVAFAFAIRS